MEIQFNQTELAPLVAQAAAMVVKQLEDERPKNGGRLAFTEAEAAARIGCKRHTLRDCRLRGEIVGAKVGRGWYYSTEEISRFLAGDGGGRVPR